MPSKKTRPEECAASGLGLRAAEHVSSAAAHDDEIGIAIRAARRAVLPGSPMAHLLDNRDLRCLDARLHEAAAGQVLRTRERRRTCRREPDDHAESDHGEKSDPDLDGACEHLEASFGWCDAGAGADVLDEPKVRTADRDVVAHRDTRTVTVVTQPLTCLRRHTATIATITRLCAAVFGCSCSKPTKSTVRLRGGDPVIVRATTLAEQAGNLRVAAFAPRHQAELRSCAPMAATSGSSRWKA
jgi:hypothetical protein